MKRMECWYDWVFLVLEQVNGVRGDLSKIDCDLDELKGLVYGLVSSAFWHSVIARLFFVCFILKFMRSTSLSHGSRDSGKVTVCSGHLVTLRVYINIYLRVYYINNICHLMLYPLNLLSQIYLEL